MKKIKDILRYIWFMLDGNKTWISTSLLAIIQSDVIQMSASLKQILTIILIGLGGAALKHHHSKGYLNPKKKQKIFYIK